MKIIEAVKKSISDKAGILFKSYPVTMVMTILITLLFCMEAFLEEAKHLPITSGQTDDIGENLLLIAFGLLIAWTWMLLTESLKYKFESAMAYKITRYAVMGASLGSIAFFLCPRIIWDYKEWEIITDEMPYAYMCVRLVIYCISAIALITAVYFMYRNSGFGFNEYWLAALGESFKASAAYVLLLIGAEVVAWIFCTLITKADWLYPVVGIIVTGLALVPLILVAFCDIRDRRDDGFIRGLVKFVLVPLATIAYVIVYLYEDLEGNVEITDVIDSARSTDISEADGGWFAAESPEVPKDVRSALEKALGDMVGAKWEPIALLSSQVVAGMNDCILCEITPVVPNPESTYSLVYLYVDPEGNAEITETADFAAETEDE
ncbi:MAG: hypothetical protein IK123_02785, partial [Lachnospiraceae bacterium]|nr:hypothetical protein [Lachnospiraceae bacterium]